MSLPLDIGRDGDRIIVAPRGDVDMSNCMLFKQALESALGETDQLEVDLAAVGHMDSSGLACLVQAYRRAADAGGALTVTNASPGMVRVLKLARIDGLMMKP